MDRMCKSKRIIFVPFMIQFVCNFLIIRHYFGQDISSPRGESFVNLLGGTSNQCVNIEEDVSKTDNTSIALGEFSKTLEMRFFMSDEPAGSMERPVKLPVPRIVHQILWKDSMTFKNYLSVLSVWKILNPYQIILHIPESFKTKDYVYNDWLQKATSRISSLQVVKHDFLGSVKTESEGALSVLKETGGMYVNLNTIINSDLWLGLNGTFNVGLRVDSSLGYIAFATNSKVSSNMTTYRDMKSTVKCVSFISFIPTSICCIVDVEIFPYYIMQDNSPFGYLSRTLFYGKPEIVNVSSSFPPIPKIVHYVWFGEKDIDYSMFLSFLSTQRFVKPKNVYIYIDHYISRPYIDKMAAYKNVQIVYYGTLKTIYQNPIVKYLHTSDIVRADILLRYGGVYIDWDVYWLKPADDLFTLGYETIASLDFFKDMFPRQDYPHTVNMGVLFARPGSRFLRIWQESFKQYMGKHHTYHAVELVYKLYEEHPDLLVIHRRLQVMCHYLRCHPLWIKNYKADHTHTDFDIANDAYTVHFTHPTPSVFSSEKKIRETKGFVGDIGRHILGI